MGIHEKVKSAAAVADYGLVMLATFYVAVAGAVARRKF